MLRTPDDEASVGIATTAAASQYRTVLRTFLREAAAHASQPKKARDKLLRLSPVQFQELITDVVDEIQRRQASALHPGQPVRDDVPPFLQPRSEFDERRNQGRQKLSALLIARVRDLSSDVLYELERRFPHLLAPVDENSGYDYEEEPPALLHDEMPKVLGAVAEPILLGALFGSIWYWISGQDLLSVVGLFVTSRPLFPYQAVRQIFTILTIDGRETVGHFRTIKEMLWSIALILTFVITVIFLQLVLLIAKVFWRITFRDASDLEKRLIWSLIALVIAWSHFDSHPWRHLWKVVAVSCHSCGKLLSNMGIAIVSFCGVLLLPVAATYNFTLMIVADRRRRRLWEIRTKRNGAYSYKPLRTGQIRLIRLGRLNLWDWVFEDVNCAIENHDLSKAPRFDCISYTWDVDDGNDDDRKRFNVQRKPLLFLRDSFLQISSIVRDILLERRSLIASRYLWIDQICINQKDIQEKNEQVRQMKEIYQTAARVVIHLGNSAGADLAIRTLLKLSLTLIPIKSDWRGFLLNGYYQDHIQEHQRQALAAFLNHRWFSRVWVVQEVAVASKLTIVYGYNSIGTITVEQAIRELDRAIMPAVHNPGAVANARRYLWMLDTRRRLQKKESITLANVLTTYRTSNATQGVDKVFALQGIVTTASDQIPAVDYAIDLKSMLYNTAQYLIKHGQYFDAIHAAGIEQQDPALDLPSWIPDWTTSPNSSIALTEFCQGQSDRNYSASTQLTPRISIDLGTNECTFCGGVIDDIAELTPPLIFAEKAANPDEFLRTWILDAKDLYTGAGGSTIPQSHNPTSIHADAFWRTLIANRDDSGSFASSYFAENYELYCKSLMQHRSTAFQPQPDPTATVWKDSKRVKKTIRFATALKRAAQGRRFAVMTDGLIGLVPACAQVGDLICVLFGAQTPVVLRKEQNATSSRYQLVGEAYVHGMMHGELAGKFGEGFDMCLY